MTPKCEFVACGKTMDNSVGGSREAKAGIGCGQTEGELGLHLLNLECSRVP